MHHDPARRTRVAGMNTLIFLVLFLSFSLSFSTAFAKKPPKTYPEEGKVIGSGTAQRAAGGGLISGNAPSTVNVRTVYTRTYKIETATKVYELDCGKPPVMFSSNPGECGGDKKIQIGDVVHFRTDKGWAYIRIGETSHDSYSNAEQTDTVEQKLRILNEDLKPDAKPAVTPPAAAKSPDTK
jgi:hypothetical protein